MNVKNRNCIRRLGFRYMWASRKRSMIAALAIALTALLFTSLFTVVTSINASYQTYTFRQIGGYCHGTFKDVSQRQAEQIAAHSKVKAVGMRTLIGMWTKDPFAVVTAEVSYMDENCTKWSYAQPTHGRMPQGGKEVAMDTLALAKLGAEAQLGATITLTYNVGDKNQAGREKTDQFTLVGYWEYDNISPVHYINISKEYAEAARAESLAEGMEGFRSDLNVMMGSALDIRGQMEQVNSDLGFVWDGYTGDNLVRIGVNWGYTTEQLAQNMDAGSIAAIAAFLILVIFTGYLIVYNIFQISVTGDIRFYGLLKTIGVTPRQLGRLIRQQALAVCLVGIPLGMLLGYGVGVALTPVIMAKSALGSAAATVSTSPLIFIASALFALGTVMISCARPGRIAARVSPVEAVKYTEAVKGGKKRRSVRGTKVHQMAFANLSRSKSKTVIVIASMSLSVVLLNVLMTFVGGFDMEKYLDSQTCADFIVSTAEYFNSQPYTHYIPREMMDEIAANTRQAVAGCGYTPMDRSFPRVQMTEEAWRGLAGRYISSDTLDLAVEARLKEGFISENTMMMGLDRGLFDKVTVVDGDISGMFDEGSRDIAIALDTDDYGKAYFPDGLPAIGDKMTVTYIEEGRYIDKTTGQLSDENTPDENLEYQIIKSHDVEYTVCAYLTVPGAMSYRYSLAGCYDTILPVERMRADSGQSLAPLYYLFDAADAQAEVEAESYLAQMAKDTSPEMMTYESKAMIRVEFDSFRRMFTLLGGFICAIVGLVGILNFFNAVMTGILSRKREFAVLQAVGMTNRQLKAMLVYEGLFYALAAVGSALLAAILLNPLLAGLMEKLFWFFSANLTVTPVLAVIPVFALLGWAIPSAMYGQTARQSVVERLRQAE